MPKVDGQSLIVSTIDGVLTNYNINGEKKWEIKLSGKYNYITSYNGQSCLYNNIICSQYDDKLYLIQSDDGEILEAFNIDEFSLENSIFDYPIIISRFFNNDGFYYGAFNLEQKAIIWTHPFNSDNFVQTLTASENSVIIYEKKEEMCCLDIKTGSVVWRCELKDLFKKSKIKSIKTLEIVGIPFIHSNSLYVALKGVGVACVSMDNGKLMWSTHVSAMKMHNFTYYSEQIYIVDAFKMVVLAASNGKVITEKQFHNYLADNKLIFLTYLAISDEMIFFADSHSGVLGALDSVNYELVWTYPIQKSIARFVGPKIIDNKLYLLDTEGNLHVFEEDK